MGVRLSEDEAWDFLHAGHTGILTTLRRDGRPVALPVWYVVDGRAIYVSTPAKSKKVTRIRNDDRGSFLVESGEAWVELAAVELSVRATLLEPGAEFDRAMAAFDEKYSAFRPAGASMPDSTKKHYSSQAVLRLDPGGKLLTWDNSRIRITPVDTESERA
jgi:PPOX class probable F420-dependent enzyme